MIHRIIVVDWQRRV